MHIEAACKNPHSHSAAVRRISYFSFQIKKTKKEILRTKVLKMFYVKCQVQKFSSNGLLFFNTPYACLNNLCATATNANLIILLCIISFLHIDFLSFYRTTFLCICFTFMYAWTDSYKTWCIFYTLKSFKISCVKSKYIFVFL
jgi:hypothetical protein